MFSAAELRVRCWLHPDVPAGPAGGAGAGAGDELAHLAPGARCHGVDGPLFVGFYGYLEDISIGY